MLKNIRVFSFIFLAAFSAATVQAANIADQTLEDKTLVPVLNQNLKYGDMITPNDIKMIEVVPAKLRGNIIRESDQLVGKTPRRQLQANRLIRDRDIATPFLIEKGKAATIFYRNNNLEISLVGEALDNGSSGDIIRFRNKESGKIFQAEVTSGGQAKIIHNRKLASVQ